MWGTGDKFNPTNNLNTLDLSDPLLFGKALANNMIRADWNPWGDLIITAVWVPIFRPAQLPRTAPLAVTTPNRPAPVQEEYIRSTLGSFAQAMPPSQINVLTMQPDPSIENSQVGVRLAGRVARARHVGSRTITGAGASRRRRGRSRSRTASSTRS